MSNREPAWTESDSEKFLSFSEIITPSRSEQMAVLANLVPADPSEAFAIAELGCGGGELAARLLARFPRAEYLGLDGSQTMLETSRQRLGRFGGRVSLQEFRLEQATEWAGRLPKPVRCIFSSLVIHHLPHAEQRALYRTLQQLLEPGGALLLIDIVQPRSSRGMTAVSENWDTVVKLQSLTMTSDLAAYEAFKQGGWNCYSHPDPMDMPAPLVDHLQWLQEAGFDEVDCFWQRGGHAVFGGFRRG